MTVWTNKWANKILEVNNGHGQFAVYVVPATACMFNKYINFVQEVSKL